MFLTKMRSFYNDTENKKVRNPVATFEVKEDQELDMRMIQNTTQNTTKWKSDVGHAPPQCSDPKSLLICGFPTPVR